MRHWSTGIETRNIIGYSGTRLLFIPRGDTIEWLNFKTTISLWRDFTRWISRDHWKFLVTEHVRRYTSDFRQRQWNFSQKNCYHTDKKKNQPPLVRTYEVRSLTTRVKVVVVNYSWSITWNITSAATSRDFRIPLMVFPMSFNPFAIYV